MRKIPPTKVKASPDARAWSFPAALFLIAAGTLMYEVILTRLLSAVCWYYLAFVSISMAMFGMTLGALAVQLRPGLFTDELLPRRLTQASLAMAISLPLSLMTMLAVPVDLSLALETLYSFLLLCVIIAVPFFFSGVVVCLSLTRTRYPIGRIYGADLLGAAAGCAGAVALLKATDGPSGVFVIAAVLVGGAALYADHEGDARRRNRSLIYGLALLALAGLNSLTPYGIQPIWSKGKIDPRTRLVAEIWNPISKVRVMEPELAPPQMWGPSPRTPRTKVELSLIDIDNDAETPVMRFEGDLEPFSFLNYDVTSLGAQLRHGGSAAVIGVGGGRDALTFAVNGFHRIVGIEVNSAITGLMTGRLGWFSGFDKIPGFELHQDEGRSYLTRSGERFDVIQASLVDTWAATAAGAMTLAENALYTVDGWQVFYQHLRPGGVIAFARWCWPGQEVETYRLFSVAWAMLLREGVQEPGAQLALIKSGGVATLLASNQPFSPADLATLRSIASDKEFQVLLLPGQEPDAAELKNIAAARTVGDLMRLRNQGPLDYSPVFDSSPYFFHMVRLNHLLAGLEIPSLRALWFVLCFTLAAVVLVSATILLPFGRWSRSRAARGVPAGALAYFTAIGLGFMLVEMSMMQQLSIFLGHPTYSLVVVLAGLILAAGAGSLASDRWAADSARRSRLPALAAALAIVLYRWAALPVIHRFAGGVLAERVALSLALVAPCGFLLGFCFPVGLRWMIALRQAEVLPWMWALNGAAAALGSFVAMFISMETTIQTCALTGAACYLVAAVALPRQRGAAPTAVAEAAPVL